MSDFPNAFEITYLDAYGIERTQIVEAVPTVHYYANAWAMLEHSFKQGFVLVLYNDRIDVVPITRILGIRVKIDE